MGNSFMLRVESKIFSSDTRGKTGYYLEVSVLQELPPLQHPQRATTATKLQVPLQPCVDGRVLSGA